MAAPWTNEELTILENNISKPIKHLMTLLPGRTYQAIKRHRYVTRIINPDQTWTDAELEFLKNNYKISKQALVNGLPDRTWRAIHGKCRNMGYVGPWNYTHWTDDELEFLRDNYNKIDCVELVEKFGRTNNRSVREAARGIGLETENPNGKKSDVTVLMSDGLETFYWIGFLLADGSFVQTNNTTLNKVQISISIKDKEHLEKLAEKLITSTKEIIRKGGPNSIVNGSGHMVSIGAVDVINVPLICEKFDIKQNKTYNPPDFYEYNFTDDQILALIVGFIDGDGTIPAGTTEIGIACHASWWSNLNFINEFIHKRFKSIKMNHTGILKKDGTVRVRISKPRLAQHIKYFIEENNLPVLGRKWDKVKALKHEIPDLDYHNKTHHNEEPIMINDLYFGSAIKAAKYFTCCDRLIRKLGTKL